MRVPPSRSRVRQAGGVGEGRDVSREVKVRMESQNKGIEEISTTIDKLSSPPAGEEDAW